MKKADMKKEVSVIDEEAQEPELLTESQALHIEKMKKAEE